MSNDTQPIERELRELLGRYDEVDRRLEYDGGWGDVNLDFEHAEAYRALVRTGLSALPALLDELDRLREENDALKSAVGIGVQCPDCGAMARLATVDEIRARMG